MSLSPWAHNGLVGVTARALILKKSRLQPDSFKTLSLHLCYQLSFPSCPLVSDCRVFLLKLIMNTKCNQKAMQSWC